MHIGLIGFGSIGREVHERLSDDRSFSFCAMTRSPIAALPAGLAQVRDYAALLATKPDLVVECAGHSAVKAHAEATLAARTPILIASLGALADAELFKALQAQATASQTKMIFPSGAIGGLDVLRAVAAEGAVEVTYTGTKPPKSWMGSPAEDLVDLSSLNTATTFFSGTGRQAASDFPKNANVVAALALAGAGFDEMRVELIADPAALANTHSYSVTSQACDYSFSIANAPTPGNPRTSLTTVLSIVQDIRTFASVTPQT